MIHLLHFSQQYAVLGEVVKEIGKVYEKSEDETLVQLAEGYYTMEEEAKGLSKLVEKQLQEYDMEILRSSVILMDASVWDCFSCGWEILTSYWWMAECAACVACIGPCWTIFTFWWCIGCLLVPCVLCIMSLVSISVSCCFCAEYMGWIDCPLG